MIINQRRILILLIGWCFGHEMGLGISATCLILIDFISEILP